MISTTVSPVMGTTLVPRKKQDEQVSAGKQVSFRCPPSLSGKLEFVAEWLGVDVSNLVRMILSENIATYERRARQIQQDQQP